MDVIGMLKAAWDSRELKNLARMVCKTNVQASRRALAWNPSSSHVPWSGLPAYQRKASRLIGRFEDG